jgi:hypothetical protein
LADEKPEQFAVYCEVAAYDRPLYLVDLTFARLLDDVVIPLESSQPFFVDGAPITKEKVRVLKIVRQKELFRRVFHDLHWRMREGQGPESKMLADQYDVRLKALFRETGEDVTSQVLKAFNTEIKPKLKDYLPNRQELIQAATRVFIESLRFLNGA